MLTKIQIKLVQHLSETQTSLTAEDIAKLMDISSRTVKRYVEIINDEIKNFELEIVSKRGMGYVLKGNPKSVKKLLKNGGESYDDNAERVRSILLTIIQSQPITIEMLSGYVHLSPSTINKLMPSIKEYLYKYSLELASKPYYGLSLEGEEFNIRTLLTDIGFNNEQSGFEINLPNLSKEEYAQIDRTVLESLQQIHVVAADRDIQNLSMRIAVSFSRSRQKYHLIDIPLPKGIRRHNLHIIHQIMDSLAEVFNIALSEEEYNYVAALSGPVIQGFDAGNINVEDHIQAFIKARIKEISLISGSNYSDDEEVIKSLSVHIKILLERMDNQIPGKNPMLGQIKKKYPLEMNYAIFLAQKIEKEYGIEIGEDELGYLAMHFGAFRERGNFRKRVAVLCNYGIGTSQLIAERISREMPELDIVGVYPIHYLESALAQDVDLIISTVEIDSYHYNVPLVVIDDFLGDDCIALIKESLYYHSSKKPQLFNFFRPEAFFKLRVQSREQAIDEMGKRMLAMGLIHQDALDSVKDREQKSSTDIGNLVAVPHTIFQGNLPSVVGIGILEQPINWGEENVQLLFFISFNSVDSAKASMFRQLYQCVKDIKLVNQLIASTSYIQFMKILAC
nr:BglG family transcription antiterminator [uncultured Caproiciproducens sp.]